MAYIKKPATNIMHNAEKLNSFPLRSGTRYGCQCLPLLFNKTRKKEREEKTGGQLREREGERVWDS